MRQLKEIERKNVSFLDDRGISHAEINLTANILKHAIFDANRSVKQLLKNGGVHDYELQTNGAENKVTITTHFLTFKREVLALSTLYKAGGRGDCRMWLGSEIYPCVEPDDIVSLIVLEGSLYAIDISKIDISNCYKSSLENPIKTILIQIIKNILSLVSR